MAPARFNLQHQWIWVPVFVAPRRNRDDNRMVRLTMAAVLNGLRVSIAVLELVAWLPLSCTGLFFTEAYLLAGNSPPPTLVIGLFLVPVALVVGPIFALVAGRNRPRWTIAALGFPVLTVALTYLSELRFP